MKKKAPPIPIVFEDDESPHFDHTYKWEGEHAPVIFYFGRGGGAQSHPEYGPVFYSIQHRNWRGPVMYYGDDFHHLWGIEYMQLFDHGILARTPNTRNRTMTCFLE